MSIQIDNCPPFTNYGSDSSITLVNPFVETSTFGMFTKRIPTGVTRYEIMFKVIDGILGSSQLWFAPFNSTGVSVGLQKPSIFQFKLIGSDIAPLTLVGLLQLIEYTTIITGAIEFKFVFTGTLPVGMPATPSIIQPSLDIYQADDVAESESITESMSYSESPSYSDEIPESESETESPEVSGSFEMPTIEPSIPIPPRMRLPKKPFTVPPAKKPEEPKEPPPKRKVTFQ